MKKLFTLIIALLSLGLNANAKELACNLSSLPAVSQNTTWDSATGTFAWSTTWYNATTIYGANDYSEYTNLHIVSTAGSFDHFRVIIKYTNGSSQTTAFLSTGDSNMTWADLGVNTENLPFISEILLSGANDGTGDIKVSSIALEGPDVKVYYPVTLTAEGVNLDASLFHNWSAADASATITSEPAYPAYTLDKADGCPYGYSTVYFKAFADLTNYAKLVIIVREGAPRTCFNRTVDQGDVAVETPRDSQYETVITNADGTKSYIVDVKAIVKAQGFAHLHCIKGANYANVNIQRMFLLKDGQSLAAIDGYRHFSSKEALDFTDNEDVEAFTVPYVKDGAVYMQKVEGKVPANTGLLLKALNENIKVKIATCEDFDSTFTNIIVPVAEEKVISKAEKGNNYLFVDGQWQAILADKTLAAGTSYLNAKSSLATLEVSYEEIPDKDGGYIENENYIAPGEAPEGYIAGQEHPTNGMFTFPEDDAQNGNQSGAATGINEANADSQIVSVTSLTGVNGANSGIVIVKYANGRTKKTLNKK